MRNFGSAMAASALIFLSLAVPAQANTETITPSSEITFDNQEAGNVRFDHLNRAWIWNTIYNPDLPDTRPRLAIFAETAGAWTRVQTVSAKKLTVKNLRFGTDGTAYATNFNKNEIVTWSVGETGTVGKAHRFRIKGGEQPIEAFPNSTGSLFVLFSSRIAEYSLPLHKHPRPIRTITSDLGNSSQLVVGADGTIYVLQGDSYLAPILIFDPGVSGSVDHSRTLLIDSGVAYQSASDIALTPDGDVAVVYWVSGVAIFDSTSSGTLVTPATWYPNNSPLTNPRGVDFMSNGTMGVADYLVETSVKVYFEE
jgi:hypothetical protein